MRAIYISVILLCFFSFLLSETAKAQLPKNVLVGYFQNWNLSSAPYIQLNEVDERYNVIDVSFAVPKSGTDYDMEFTPSQVSVATFISQMQAVQAKDKKVIISMGGANSPIALDSDAEKNKFISSMMTILNTYPFDGIDIDFEGSSITTSGGTIANPTDTKLINLIDALKQLMAQYRVKNGKKLLVTFSPETAFVQGGQSSYGGIWGAYLPVMHALRDSIDLVHVQLYNSGSMYGLDRAIYTQGTADFIVALTEALIQGFNTNGGFFTGFPEEKIAIGLPACPSAAGSGYTDPSKTIAAVNYLLGKGSKPGSYTLVKPSAYPNLRGMMTWSVNWDATASCGTAKEYANTYCTLFCSTNTGFEDLTATQPLLFYPNPSADFIQLKTNVDFQGDHTLRMHNVLGELVFEQEIITGAEQLSIAFLPNGIYSVQFQEQRSTLVKN